MKLRATKLRVMTAEGEFGFAISFNSALTIIRGNNSSGKSSIVGSIIYGLGMEEIMGGRGDKVLPYGLRDHLYFNEQKITIAASEVLVEIQNNQGRIITIRRAIKDSIRSHKLVEIHEGAAITDRSDFVVSKSTYLFDAGAAQIEEGFHRFLEDFLDLKLPLVPTASGGETKLYIQTVFAALIVEQKRGWSDYIANIPYYGIKEAKTRVVEYLLGLSIFEAKAKRARLNTESVQIFNAWESEKRRLAAKLQDLAVRVSNVPEKPTALFDPKTMLLSVSDGERFVSVADRIESLRAEFFTLEEALKRPPVGNEVLREQFDAASAELLRVSHIHESVVANITILEASKQDYVLLGKEIEEDLTKNKAAKKLRELGATVDIASAVDRCPTCDQPVDDSVYSQAITGPQMGLDENIRYLGQQRDMLSRQLSGVDVEIAELKATSQNVKKKTDELRARVDALRADFSSGVSQSRADIQRQYQIQNEVGDLRKAERALEESATAFNDLVKKFIDNKAARESLPKNDLSESDKQKVSVFEKMFRANASSFGYASANIEDIVLNEENLIPHLSHIELRQMRTQADIKADIKLDSSASDFVRLIWSYLVGAAQASDFQTVRGNHPGLIVFDEPGQHSMSERSQNTLLRMLASEAGLQSIVAASFDESQAVFDNATEGVRFKLVEWPGKSVGPISERDFL